MLFNIVDTEGVEFHQLNKLNHLNEQLAFKHRFEKKRWLFLGPVLALVGLLTVITWTVFLALVTSTQSHFFQHFKTIFDVIGFIVGLVVWILGSAILGGVMFAWGIAIAEAPYKGKGLRIWLAQGVYPRDKLLSSLDFAFPMLRDLIEASADKLEVRHIETFFASKKIFLFNEHLHNEWSIEQGKEQKLRLIDAVQQFAAETPLRTSSDFDQLRAQVKADFQTSVKAEIKKKEASLTKLRAMVN